MEYDNVMTLSISAVSQNESFARVAVAAFVSQLDPTVSEITDIKTAVSEAVTNAIIHGYGNQGAENFIKIKCALKGNEIFIEISDEGAGIEDIEKARIPLYTSLPHMERSGMGFTVMETFMDQLDVESLPQKGTTVRMSKEIRDINAD